MPSLGDYYDQLYDRMQAALRQFIRHPITIPIEITSRQSCAARLDAYSLGLGGLCVKTNKALPAGTYVHIKIPYLHPAFESDARVVWCNDGHGASEELSIEEHSSELERSIEIGIEFLNADDAYRARMVEQICHIENYRQQISTHEGRNLSAQDAATEWISKFAANFPN